MNLLPTESIGHLIANSENMQPLIYAPVSFSANKGHKGTLEAAASEAIILMAFFEAMHSLYLSADLKISWKHRTFHITRMMVFAILMICEANIFYPKAVHHWEKYNEPKTPQSVGSLSSSIGAISVMTVVFKFFFEKTRFFEPPAKEPKDPK